MPAYSRAAPGFLALPPRERELRLLHNCFVTLVAWVGMVAHDFAVISLAGRQHEYLAATQAWGYVVLASVLVYGSLVYLFALGASHTTATLRWAASVGFLYETRVSLRSCVV